MIAYLIANGAAVAVWLPVVYCYFGNRPQLTGQPMPRRRRDLVALTTTVLVLTFFTPLFTEWMTTSEKIGGALIVIVGTALCFALVRSAGEKASRRARVQFEARCDELARLNS